MKMEEPDQYKEFLEMKKAKSKQWRDQKKATATEEEKEHQRARVRERVAKCRKNKKEKQVEVPKTPQKRVTRQELEKMNIKKAKDAERKRAEKARWSWQKKKAESIKAVERKHSKKTVKKSQEADVSGGANIDNVDPGVKARTKASRAQALHRVQKALPKNPAFRRETLKDLMLKNQTINDEVKPLRKCSRKLIRQLIMHLSIADKQTRKAGLKMLSVSISRQSLYSMRTSNSFGSTKLRKSFSSKAKIVEDFLMANCTISSEKKCITKKGPKLILNAEMDRLLSSFKNANPEFKISKSFFFNCRQQQMKLSRDTKFNQCLCEICENVNLKIQSVRSIVHDFPNSKLAVMDNILCPKGEGEFHKADCITGSCKSCGAEQVMNLVKDRTDLNNEVEYHEWVNRKLAKGSTTVTKKVKESKRMTVAEVLDLLVSDLRSFPKHHFNAKWQYQQFQKTKSMLKEGELLMVYDFAENFRTQYQDEVQSAHWNYAQATVHPVVCYHCCGKSDCRETVTHSVVLITDDLTHDYYTVRIMLRHVYDMFQQQFGIKRTYEWSDGWQAQYKSKYPFYFLQQSAQEEGFKIHRNFFGSRHGKNPSDGESAILKSAATHAVKCQRAIISSAHDLYTFAQSNLARGASDENCAHFQHSFIYIPAADIKRDKLPPVKPLPNTRLVHCIRSEDGKELLYRNLTCLCEGCETGNACDNQHVGQWKSHAFKVAFNDARKHDNAIDGLIEMPSTSTNATESPTTQDAPEHDNAIDGLIEMPSTSTNATESPTTKDAPEHDNAIDGLIEMPSTSTNATESPTTKDDSQSVVVSNPHEQSMSDQLPVEDEQEPEEPTDCCDISANDSSLTLLSESTMEHLESSLNEVSTTGSPQIQEGQYEDVFLYGKNERLPFRGMVDEVENGELLVHLMKPIGNGLYVWPFKDDTSMVPIYDVVQTLNPPSLVAPGRYEFL